MDNIIKFPTTTEKEYLNIAIIYKEPENKKIPEINK